MHLGIACIHTSGSTTRNGAISMLIGTITLKLSAPIKRLKY